MTVVRHRKIRNMPPNTFELPMESQTEAVISAAKPIEEVPPSIQKYEENNALNVFQSSLNLLAHILIGMTVAISFLFAFRGGLPLGATPMHIVLCVSGYQLLMAQAILSLSASNGWSSKLTFIDKRRAHWILQIAGSGLAIGGSFHKIIDKSVHWNSLHGQFGLVALVFTSVSLVNGLTSLWAYELRHMVSGNLSKITHICFGTVAFVAASICLCYGMDKAFFRAWATDDLTSTFIAFVIILTVIVIVNPLLSFYTKTKTAIRK